MFDEVVAKLKLINDLKKSLYIGFSGGVDSHVLLHLCAKNNIPTTAIHINHNLSKNALNWQQHCQNVCNNLQVKLIIENVHINQSGDSLEQSARFERFNCFKNIVKDNILLLGHHLDDQCETILLRLFRGSGVTGLSGILEKSDFLGIDIRRLLLEIPKSEILEYAKINNLKYITDESNFENKFDRNFLRNDILPILRTRWPNLDNQINSFAKICDKYNNYVDENIKEDFNKVKGSIINTLSVSKLLEFNDVKRDLIVRYWLKVNNKNMPSVKKISQIKGEVLLAGIDKNPILKLDGYEIRRYRDDIFVLDHKDLKALEFTNEVALNSSIDELEAVKLKDGRTINLYEKLKSSNFKFENFKSERFLIKTANLLPIGAKVKMNNRPSKSIKNFFQERAIAPWRRLQAIYICGENNIIEVII